MADRSVHIQRVSSGVVGPQALGDALSLFLARVVSERVIAVRRRVVALAPYLHLGAPEGNRVFVSDPLGIDIQVPSQKQAGERHV